MTENVNKSTIALEDLETELANAHPTIKVMATVAQEMARLRPLNDNETLLEFSERIYGFSMIRLKELLPDEPSLQRPVIPYTKLDKKTRDDCIAFAQALYNHYWAERNNK